LTGRENSDIMDKGHLRKRAFSDGSFQKNTGYEKRSTMKRYLELFLTMLKIGAFTFGGGYAMIALLEAEFVSKK
jgi:hypothetical protein